MKVVVIVMLVLGIGASVYYRRARSQTPAHIEAEVQALVGDVDNPAPVERQPSVEKEKGEVVKVEEKAKIENPEEKVQRLKSAVSMLRIYFEEIHVTDKLNDPNLPEDERLRYERLIATYTDLQTKIVKYEVNRIRKEYSL